MKKQKQKTVIYYIDKNGIKCVYRPRWVVYPERTKLWQKLSFWLVTDQVEKIGYEPYIKAI